MWILLKKRLSFKIITFRYASMPLKLCDDDSPNCDFEQCNVFSCLIAYCFLYLGVLVIVYMDFSRFLEAYESMDILFENWTLSWYRVM